MTNSQLAKQEKQARRQYLVNQLLWIPLILLLGIVPLLMKCTEVPITDAALSDAINETTIMDIYSNIKSVAIISLGVIMLIVVFLFFDKNQAKWDKNIKWYLIGGSLFLGGSLVSTILSDYSSVAWWGVPDRAEGFVITAIYILMMAYTLYSLMDYKNYTYIIGSLGFLTIVTTIIGIFQYVGYDLLTNVDFLKKLIFTEELLATNVDVVSDFPSGKVYGTMFHYNYMGSFGAMMVPFFVSLTLLIRNKWIKVFSGIISVCAMFLLFGSTSRAGIIGLIVAVVMGIVILGKSIIKKWKITVGIIILLTTIVIGFNSITDGAIFSRIPTLIEDGLALFTESENDFDYRDYIPVREVVHEERKMKIVFQTETMYIANEDGNPSFLDGVGNKIEYVLNVEGDLSNLETVYSTNDKRFNQVKFTYVQITGLEEGQEAPVILSMSYEGRAAFYFMLNEEKGVVLADGTPIQEMQIDYPETFGFKGKEKIGSARGYIWSRSIPLMKDTLLIGNGPDTYPIVFPQDDLLGKWWTYGTPRMIVDKAHNLYLQFFINNGGLAFLGFLIMIVAYIIQSLKLYALKDYYDYKEILGIATALAIVGYLGAGIFNDSVISVAPIFWILLGAGMAVNFMVNKERIEMNQRISNAVSMNR